MAGRPKKTFTDKEVEQIKTLARCHCPDSEIAAFMNIGEMTIRRHFGTLIKEERESGRASIRAKQFRLAMDGDRTMLIWLGKQLLGQADKHEWDLKNIPEDKWLDESERRLGIKKETNT